MSTWPIYFIFFPNFLTIEYTVASLLKNKNLVYVSNFFSRPTKLGLMGVRDQLRTRDSLCYGVGARMIYIVAKALKAKTDLLYHHHHLGTNSTWCAALPGYSAAMDAKSKLNDWDLKCHRMGVTYLPLPLLPLP